jgi:hypothetical protein
MLINKSTRKLIAILDSIATVLFIWAKIAWNFCNVNVEIPNEWRIQYGAVMTFYFADGSRTTLPPTPMPDANI